MNINKLTDPLTTGSRAKPQAANIEQGKKQAAVSQSADNIARPQDKVLLSASSGSMQSLEAEIKAMPVVDDATVDRVRQAIDSGEYKIDYNKLAGNMLNFEDNLS